MQKLFKKTIGIAASSIGGFILMAMPVLATGGDPRAIDLKPANQWSNLPNLTIPGAIAFGIQAVMIIAGVLFFFMLVWGGIEWILAGGDKAGAENARKRITSALVGIAIVFSAWAIMTLINVVFGVDLLKFRIPSILELS